MVMWHYLDDIPNFSLLLWKASVEYSQNLKDVEELNLGQSLEQSEILSNIYGLVWGKKGYTLSSTDRSLVVSCSPLCLYYFP